MSQLIHKGGFRERAQRSTRHTDSENQLTKLPERGYAIHVTSEDSTNSPTSEVLNEPVQQPSMPICNRNAISNDVTENG